MVAGALSSSSIFGSMLRKGQLLLSSCAYFSLITTTVSYRDAPTSAIEQPYFFSCYQCYGTELHLQHNQSDAFFVGKKRACMWYHNSGNNG